MTSQSEKYRVTRHRAAKFPFWILVAAAFASVWHTPPKAHGQVAAKALTDVDLTDSERREETLKWLDEYLTESVLLTAEDATKIRDAVAGMSPSQLERWLTQTKTLRAYIESPEWQETKSWLRTFLRVQAIYSDKEIEQLHREIFNADADQMLEILQRIQAKHESMVWMYNASKETRKMDLAQRDKNMARQAAANRAAQASASRSSALFGNAGGSGGAKTPSEKGHYRIPSAWRGWGGGWGVRYW